MIGWEDLPRRGKKWPIVEGNVQSMRSHAGLEKVVAELNPKIVVETGFNAGHSSCIFLNHSDAIVYSFDEAKWDYVDEAYNILIEIFSITTDRLHLIKGDSKETIPKFFKKNKFKIDLAFIDGGHDYDTCYSDLLHIHKRMAKGGVIILDDVNNQNVKKAIKDMKMGEKFTEFGKLKSMKGFKNDA